MIEQTEYSLRETKERWEEKHFSLWKTIFFRPSFLLKIKEALQCKFNKKQNLQVKHLHLVY